MKDLLLKHNRHWEDGDIETGIERENLGFILKSLDVKQITAITGGRRTGKSFLFRQIINYLIQSRGVNPENIIQINFEDPFFISQSEDVLETLFSRYLELLNPQGKIYIFFDEIQNMDKWQFWLRTTYDLKGDAVKIFITGSNSELLSVELGTHLTGRVISYENFPFSYREYFKIISDEYQIEGSEDAVQLYKRFFSRKEEILHHIEHTFSGSLYPEIIQISDARLKKDILEQYLENVLFKDIIPRFSIRNSKTIEQLTYYLSTNFTSQFSLRKLAEAVGSNENTIKEYLSYLEKAYLFFSVGFYEYSLKKQFKRNRKVYCIDNGLRDATAWSFSKDEGRYAENAVFVKLRRTHKNIYYWQEDKTHKEIDFVVVEKNRPTAVNVTYTDEIPEREFEGFSAFSNYAQVTKNILVSKNRFETIEYEGVEIEIVPLWLFLLSV